MSLISVVVPVFNEQEVLEESYRRLTGVMRALGESYELVFVNDGSRDRTPGLLDKLASEDPAVRAVHFSRNFGHQAAITAGMQYAEGDAVVIIDADLQDPPEVIPEMVQKWREGFEVVYGHRVKRKGETFFKKFTASVFYRFLGAMTDVKIPTDTGDFRLIDRKVVDALKSLPEKNRYVRGLVPWVGFRQTNVDFVREERFAGETKYPLKKMIKFSVDGITSFSYKPLKFASYIGFLLSGVSFLYMIWIIIKKLAWGGVVDGWASMMAVNLFLDGIILIILGIIGEYIGRIYDESKNRPIFIVRELRGFERKDGGKD